MTTADSANATTEPDLDKIEAAIADARARQDWPMLVDQLDLKARQVEQSAAEVAEFAKIVFNHIDAPRAAAMTRRAIRMDPDNVDYRFQLADIYYDQKRYPEAKSVFADALAVAPDNMDAKRRLAQVLQEEDPNSEEAEALLREVIENNPTDIRAMMQLGAICAGKKARYPEAEEIFGNVLEIAPDAPSALHNYGLLKRFQGDLETAETYLRRACETEPEESDFAFSLGTCYLFMHDLEKALEWFAKAVEINPDNNAAQVYIAFALFHQGKIRDGWAQYERRLALDVFKPMDYGRPRWEGEDLDGNTLLILPEQGMGDNIQFIRYASQAAERNGQVVVVTHYNLVPLFTSVKGVRAVEASAVGARNFHRYIPLLSLPYVLETDENNIPGDVPYLSAPQDKAAAWKEKLGAYDGLKVGLCWRGNPRHVNDQFRSSSLAEMSQLLDIDGVSFFSLHKDRPDFETELPDGLIDIGSGFEDFGDTAGAMEALDLVISVDTSVCHLAGALARPTWIMLARGPDFRWGLTSETTPWYPTAKLFRQATLGDWSDVFARMSKELRALAKA